MKIPSLSECRPGMVPTEFNVMIATPDTESKTAGGIILIDKVADQNKTAQMRGRLVAVSPLAFNYDTWPDGARRPESGDEVVFAKYAGVLVEGNDGREYRMCKDKDVCAIVTGDVA